MKRNDNVHGIHAPLFPAECIRAGRELRKLYIRRPKLTIKSLLHWLSALAPWPPLKAGNCLELSWLIIPSALSSAFSLCQTERAFREYGSKEGGVRLHLLGRRGAEGGGRGRRARAEGTVLCQGLPWCRCLFPVEGPASFPAQRRRWTVTHAQRCSIKGRSSRATRKDETKTSLSLSCSFCSLQGPRFSC